MSTGLVIFAHGSSVPEANEGVKAAAAATARAGKFEHVEAAFLELAHPNLDEAVSRLAQKGVSRVLVVPYFLTLGIHLQRDLPEMVERLSRLHPEVQIRVARPLEGQPGLIDILLSLAREALSGWE